MTPPLRSRRLWIAAVGVIMVGVAVGGVVWYKNMEVSASSTVTLTSTVPPPQGTGYGTYGGVLIDDSYFARFDAGDTKKALVAEMALGDPGVASDIDENITITRGGQPIALTVTGRARTSRQAADLANMASAALVDLINTQDPAAGLVFMTAIVSTRATS